MLIGWYRIPESTREPLELVVNPHGLQERSQVREQVVELREQVVRRCTCISLVHKACSSNRRQAGAVVLNPGRHAGALTGVWKQALVEEG